MTIIDRSFEVAALLFSPIVGHMLEKVGRKNSILFGFAVIVLATLSLSMTVLIENDFTFLLVSIIARFIQGMGDMWVQTSC
jgi:MFS family permease